MSTVTILKCPRVFLPNFASLSLCGTFFCVPNLKDNSKGFQNQNVRNALLVFAACSGLSQHDQKYTIKW